LATGPNVPKRHPAFAHKHPGPRLIGSRHHNRFSCFNKLAELSPGSRRPPRPTQTVTRPMIAFPRAPGLREPPRAHKHPPASPLPRAYAPTHKLKETPYCAETEQRGRACNVPLLDLIATINKERQHANLSFVLRLFVLDLSYGLSQTLSWHEEVPYGWPCETGAT
jgi:hypothetical protein